MLRAVVALVVGLALSGMGSAGERSQMAAVTALERNAFFTECSPMDVRVKIGKGFAKRFRLDDELLRIVEGVFIAQVAERELYLPVAGQVPTRMQTLEILLEVNGKVAIFTLRLGRFIDLGFGKMGLAIVWQEMSAGTFRRNESGDAIDHVKISLRDFLTQYVEANEDGNPDNVQWCSLQPGYYEYLTSEAEK